MRRVKTQAQDWLYSPRRMGYRTWFYAAFVCAYACCLSAGTTRPVRAPFRGHVGSRTCLGGSRVDSNFQLLHVAPFLCHGLDLDSDPSVCIPRSIFGQMAGAPWNDCHSYDSLSVQSFLPVCVHVPFCPGLDLCLGLGLCLDLCLCHCWRSKKAIFCAGVFALCLCNGLGSCFDYLCLKTSTVLCEASF